jgi:hypothetical protein
MASASQKLLARHPLQRLPSPSRNISLLIHLAGIISFSLSYKYLVDFPTMINDSYGWHWQYLTIIGLTIAMATFVFGFLADITLSPQLFLIKNTRLLKYSLVYSIGESAPLTSLCWFLPKSTLLPGRTSDFMPCHPSYLPLTSFTSLLPGRSPQYRPWV